MKRITLFLATVLPLGMALVSCEKAETPKTYAETINENVIGKWKSVSEDDSRDLTNRRTIMTFYQDGTLLLSRSQTNRGDVWENHYATSYSVKDSVISYVSSRGENETQMNVLSISANEIKAKVKGGGRPKRENGDSVRRSRPDSLRIKKFVKVNVDYSKDIIGTWEGVELTGYETYGDEMHRWEFKADGTYVYYIKNEAGEWAPSSNILNDYNVDGDWLATRWMDPDSVEYREWWDIDKVDQNEMIWSALRNKNDAKKREDGQGRPEGRPEGKPEIDAFETTFKMKRIK